MSYKVQFLDDAEFDQLPANNITEKVGVAYPSIGTAYVRKTGVNAVDVFTAMHELEHLKGDDLGEHFDSENGCYYKGFGDVFKRVAPIALGFLAPALLPGLGGMMSGLGGAVKGVAGNFGLGNIFGQFGNAIGGAGKAVGGALGVGGSGASSSASGASGMLGPAPMAGRIGAGQMVGGQAAYDAAPNVFPSMLGAAGNASREGAMQATPSGGGVASDAVSGLAQHVLGGQSPMGQFQDPGQGSSTPNVQSNPNVIAGATGSGSAGGPGGSPGSVGGGAVSKLKQYLQQSGNQGNGAGGMF